MAWLTEPPSDERTASSSTVTLTHRLLAVLGVRVGAVVEAIREADRRNDGGDAATVLIETGQLDPAVWWPALAGALGLAYRDEIAPIVADTPPLPSPPLDRDAQQIWISGASLGIEAHVLAVAPRGRAVARIAAFLAEHPALRSRIVVTGAEALRAGLRRQMEATMTEAAVTGLRRARPDMSASRPPPARAVRRAGLLLAASPFVAVLLDFGVEILLLTVFLPLTLLRLMAAIEPRGRPEAPPLADDALPTYAVLVPLYREAAMIPALAVALAALDYPRHKLDLKLLVEADDPETRMAAMAHATLVGWDVVVVPPSQPRTKPKALAFALQLVDAELVTVYDAEDHPASDQLRRAAAAFAVAPERTACLQAALTIDRPPARWGGRWLKAQFALEYLVQFQVLLPWYATNFGFFLLGGTSNHFRRAALVAVGGWDPHNVTEDADISVRLRRAGWRLDVLASETREEAPTSWPVWFAQRRRWLKGWLQTWLVHSRRPGRLLAEMGPGGFVLFHLLLGGQILSAFVYPASLFAVGLLATGVRPLLQERSFVSELGFALALVTGALAWGTTAAQALMAAPRPRWPATIFGALALPIYWLLLYPAVIGAILELATAPFQWNKTPHGADDAPRRGRRSRRA